MPTLPFSPARAIHSWSFVYLRLVGYDAISSSRSGPAEAGHYESHSRPAGPKGLALLTSLIERHRHDAGARAASADVDVEFRAHRRVLDRQVRHADRFLQERRLRAARDETALCLADIRVVPVARDAAVQHLEAGDLPRHAGRFLRAQRGRANEVILLPADNPAEVRFERRRLVVDVVAVEAHARFEAQRVARAETARNHICRFAGLQNRLPHPVRGLRRDKHFKAVLAGVARA